VLLRGCNALRAAIETDPAELSHWRGLHELLCERGELDAARAIAHAACAVGHADAELPATVPAGLGAQAFSASLLGQVAPQGAVRAIAQLLRALTSQLDPQLPFEHAHEPILASAAREYAPSVTPALGLGELQLSRCVASLCLPLSAAPLHICVGRAWLDAASENERSFALLRAMAMAKLDLQLLVRCAPDRFGLVLNALWSIADRTHVVAVPDATEQARVAQQLAESLDAREHARVKQLVDAVVEHEDLDPRRLQGAALEYGTRVALCVTGDVWAGLNSLLRLRGKPSAQLDPRERIELCRTDPALRALLSFSISEPYVAARTLANGSPRKEPG